MTMTQNSLPTYTVGAKADWGLIPDYMRGGIRRYIENGIEPGDFLQAVLRNDLRGAFERADGTNVNLIKEYIMFLYNYAPGGSWGSPENYEAWIKKSGLGWKEIAP
jgi:hypothetical protein